ncbi:MAG TPA: hypothetical protein VIR55_05410 [Ignavibacteria bacterium]
MGENVHPLVCYTCHKVCSLITLLPFSDGVHKDIRQTKLLFTMVCKNYNNNFEKYDFFV